MGPWRIGGALLGAVCAVVAAWWLVRSPAPPVEATIPFTSTSTVAVATVAPSTVPTLIAVHVAGAVSRPGVYVLLAGARVDDAVRAAGGATTRADLDMVNLARGVVDGEQVFIPRRGQRSGGAPAPGGSSPGAPATPRGPVNLNTATASQLVDLPGIGPSIAAAIIEYRNRVGGFASVDDLEKVPGIGPAKMETIRPLVAV